MEPGILQAYAAILAMRAAVSEPVEFDRNHLGTDETEHTDAQVAVVLATMEPVVCTPGTRAGALVIHTVPATPDDVEFAVGPGLLSERQPGERVLLLGRREAMLLDAGCLEDAWTRFVLDAPDFALGGRPPTAAEASAGIGWVVIAGGAGTTHFDAAISYPAEDVEAREAAQNFERRFRNLVEGREQPVGKEDLLELVRPGPRDSE